MDSDVPPRRDSSASEIILAILGAVLDDCPLSGKGGNRYDHVKMTRWRIFRFLQPKFLGPMALIVMLIFVGLKFYRYGITFQPDIVLHSQEMPLPEMDFFAAQRSLQNLQDRMVDRVEEIQREAQPTEEGVVTEEVTQAEDIVAEDTPPVEAEEILIIPPEVIDDSKPLSPARIAIIIDDMGVDKVRSQKMETLSPKLTLAYLPYADDVQGQVDRAKALGHEIMLHLPMEAMGENIDEGPYALTGALSVEEFDDALARNLNGFSGYMGVNNHMGSLLTQSEPHMIRVIAALKTRGVYFVDSRTVAQSVAYNVAAAGGVPHATRDIFLDHDPSLPAVRSMLKQAEKHARETGQAIVIGHPKDDTYTALKEWIPKAEARGIKIVPASFLVED